MGTLKWHDPYYGIQHTVRYNKPWKRLDRCNALYTIHTSVEFPIYSDEVCYKKCFAFQSYAAPLLIVEICKYVDSHHNARFTCNANVAEYATECSATTNKQITRFMRFVERMTGFKSNLLTLMALKVQVAKNERTTSELTATQHVIVGLTTPHYMSYILDRDFDGLKWPV